jgi:hypothetical protein
MKLQERDIARKVRKILSDCSQHSTATEQRDRARTNQDFFRGGQHQWTEEDWYNYKSRGVTPVTINRCKPVLKGLLGMYLQSKQEVKVSPRRSGTAVVAQVHTEVLKHTQDISYADYVYAQVFMRAGIDSEAYLKLEIDRAENVNGQPKIKGLSLSDVDVDRNALEYDLNESAAYVVERQWLDKDEIKALWPDQEQKIKTGMAETDSLASKPEERLATWAASDETGAAAEDLDENDRVSDMELLRKYRHLLKRVYWKEIKPRMIVADRQGKEQTKVLDDEAKIEKLSRKAKRSVRFLLVNVVNKVLHESVMLGQQLLEDTPEPLGPGVSDYPIVRYSPLWDLGYASGVFDDAVPLNREENIHRTQGIRIINQVANSGFVAGSTTDKKALAELKKFGSVPGVVIDKSKFGDFIEKITPNPLPPHFLVGEQFERDVKRVTGVDDAAQGYETGKADSGRALNLKLQANRASSELYFNNFYRTLEIFGKLMMDVQLNNNLYTDAEIMAVVAESSMIDRKLMELATFRMTSRLGGELPEPQPLPPMAPEAMAAIRNEHKPMVMDKMRRGAEAAQQYARAYPQLAETWEQGVKAEAVRMLLRQLRDDKGMYGVKVTVSPSAPTERMAQFLQIDALMSKYGQLIPPDVFIDLTDLPEAKREQIKARLMQAQQAQQAQPQVAGAAA